MLLEIKLTYSLCIFFGARKYFSEIFYTLLVLDERLLSFPWFANKQASLFFQSIVKQT